MPWCRTMYDGYVIGISEIWTKSEKVRQLLIKKLVRNIKQRIPEAHFEIRRGRIILRPFILFLQKMKKLQKNVECLPRKSSRKPLR